MCERAQPRTRSALSAPQMTACGVRRRRLVAFLLSNTKRRRSLSPLYGKHAQEETFSLIALLWRGVMQIFR